MTSAGKTEILQAEQRVINIVKVDNYRAMFPWVTIIWGSRALRCAHILSQDCGLGTHNHNSVVITNQYSQHQSFPLTRPRFTNIKYHFFSIDELQFMFYVSTSIKPDLIISHIWEMANMVLFSPKLEAQSCSLEHACSSACSLLAWL